MGCLEELKLKAGVIYGDDVLALFKYAKEHQFAMPAINVTSSSTIIATLEAARDSKSPIVIQISNGGGAFFAGKGIPNSNQEASIAGSVAAAHFVRSIAPICAYIPSLSIAVLVLILTFFCRWRSGL